MKSVATSRYHTGLKSYVYHSDGIVLVGEHSFGQEAVSERTSMQLRIVGGGLITLSVLK